MKFWIPLIAVIVALATADTKSKPTGSPSAAKPKPTESPSIEKPKPTESPSVKKPKPTESPSVEKLKPSSKAPSADPKPKTSGDVDAKPKSKPKTKAPITSPPITSPPTCPLHSSEFGPAPCCSCTGPVDGCMEGGDC